METGEPKGQPRARAWPPGPPGEGGCGGERGEGRFPIAYRPILMRVFRNKLAGLLKSLLWPMNI